MPAVHEVVAASVAAQGSTTCFGLIGDGNVRFVASLVERHGIHYVAANAEAGATSMADGYARATGYGIASVTQGPGLTNTITPLTEAARHRTPMLLVAGERPLQSRPMHRNTFQFQGIDQRAVVAPTGAGYAMVRSPESASFDTARAIELSLIERRPYVLALPADLQTVDAPELVRTPRQHKWAPRPSEAELDAAAGIIASARRPLILAGSGVLVSGACGVVTKLAERLDAPIVSTLLAKDAFASSGRSIGILGTFSTEMTMEWVAKADCLIALGASLNVWTTLDGTLLDGKTIVQVDDDRAALGRWVAPSAAVYSDAGEFVNSIIGLLDDGEVGRSGFFTDASTSYIEEPQPTSMSGSSGNGTDMQTVLTALRSVLPSDRNLVFDVGRFWKLATSQLMVSHPRGAFHTYDYASIGLSTAMGIGVACADRTRPTVVISGDGGFMLGGLNELHTAVRQSLDLIVVVLNDGSYGAEHAFLAQNGWSVELSMMSWPDLARVAAVLGLQSATARTPAELDDLRPMLHERTRPILIDVVLDPSLVPMEREVQ